VLFLLLLLAVVVVVVIVETISIVLCLAEAFVSRFAIQMLGFSHIIGCLYLDLSNS
jgi:hypothetical protein